MVYTIVCHLYTLPDDSSISRVKNKLIEASRTYRTDKETLAWDVMQDVHDPRKFTIVERYLRESVSGLMIFFFFFWKRMSLGCLLELAGIYRNGEAERQALILRCCGCYC